jgi:hypothetical protein
MTRAWPALVLLLAVSCGPHGKYMGMWKEAATPQKTWEFKSDGTIVHSFLTTVVRYKYKWTGDDTLEVMSVDGQNPRKAKLTLKGDRLLFELSNPDQAIELVPF